MLLRARAKFPDLSSHHTVCHALCGRSIILDTYPHKSVTNSPSCLRCQQEHNSEVISGSPASCSGSTENVHMPFKHQQHLLTFRDVTERAKIHNRRMRISCAKFIGCECRFVAQSKSVPAIIATVVQLSYLKLTAGNKLAANN